MRSDREDDMYDDIVTDDYRHFIGGVIRPVIKVCPAAGRNVYRRLQSMGPCKPLYL